MIGELLSLACAVVWGLSVVLFKKAEEVPPVGMNLFKNVIGLLLLGLTLLVMGTGLEAGRSREDWVRLAASGAIGLSLADSLFLEALKRIGPGLVAILDCIYAPLVIVFSVILLGERPSLAFFAGAPLILLGVLVATWQRPEWAPAGGGRTPIAGIAIALVSIALMALGIVVAKPALDHSAGVVEPTFVRLLAGAVFLQAWVLLRPGRRRVVAIFRPARVWAWAVPAAVLGTYVSMLLWIGGIKYTDASTAAVLNQMSVVFTLLAGRLMLGESLSRQRIVGGGAALAGALVIVYFTGA